MTKDVASYEPNILLLSTVDCAYPGADWAGQMHLDHYLHAYNLRMPDPVVLPDDFYFYCFEQGFDGIIIMSCGVECPYPGAYDRLAKRVDELYTLMKQRNLEIDRLRLTAICTVCAQAYIKEIEGMVEKLNALPPAKEVLAQSSQGGN
jgi:F420-non-reducing hydrogenase iron-sulfur subunit